MEIAQARTNRFFLCLTMTLFMSTQGESRAHHKVHNLALYPERHSWCQATPIRQEIAHAPECHTKTIDNVVCLGACFSYSVPRAQDDPVIPPYCDACRPTVSAWKVVTLNCTKETTGEPYTMTKNVEIISNCSCVDCNDNKPRYEVVDGADDSTEDDGDELQDPLFEGNNEVEQEDEDDSLNDNVPVLPTLHKLKSVSEELRDINNAEDEDMMMNENKIPADDDEDPDTIRVHKDRQRED